MTISTVSAPNQAVNYATLNRQISFRGNEENQNTNYVPVKIQTEATTGKKWGVGLASSFCPGLGQAINGQWGKGFGYLLGTLGLATATQIATVSALAKENTKLGFGIAILGGLATLGVEIANICDAVKNAKSETIQMMPENQAPSKLDYTA